LAIVAMRERVSEPLIDKVAKLFLFSHGRQLFNREPQIDVFNSLLEVVVAVVSRVPVSIRAHHFNPNASHHRKGKRRPNRWRLKVVNLLDQNASALDLNALALVWTSIFFSSRISTALS
jgi:hypothetical protein